jgi:hypothetical protein
MLCCQITEVIERVDFPLWLTKTTIDMVVLNKIMTKSFLTTSVENEKNASAGSAGGARKTVTLKIMQVLCNFRSNAVPRN